MVLKYAFFGKPIIFYYFILRWTVQIQERKRSVQMMKLNGSLIKILKSKLFYFEMPLKIQNPSYVFFFCYLQNTMFLMFFIFTVPMHF